MTASLRPASVDARMGFYWGVVVLFIVLGALFHPTLASLNPATFPMTSPVVMESLASGSTLEDMVTGKTSLPFGVLFAAPPAHASVEQQADFNAYVLPFRNRMAEHLTIFAGIGMVVAGLALTGLVKTGKI